MRRLFLGAALVVLSLAGLTLTNGTSAGRVETTKRSVAVPAARPADADQLWAANPVETEVAADEAADDDVSYEGATPSGSSDGYEAARVDTAADDGSEPTSDDATSETSDGLETSDGADQTADSDPDDSETNGEDANIAVSDGLKPDGGETSNTNVESADDVVTDEDRQDAGSDAGARNEVEAAASANDADGSANEPSSFATSDNDESDTSTEPAEAVSSASSSSTTTTTAAPRTTTTRAVTTTTRKPAPVEVDDPTAALANAIHSEQVTTSTAKARVQSKSQPFLTQYGADGLPQLQPLPTDPYAPTPDIRLGSIRIPAIGLDHSLHQGMTLTALDRGPSQWPGSAMPGQVGNMVIGGHRTTRTRPFRNLDDLNKGDEVIVTDDLGVDHTYEVLVVEIVTPDAVHIASQTAEPTATLFACHPPGSARQRIVVKLALA